MIEDRQTSNALPLTISGGTAGPPADFEYEAPDVASLVASGPGQLYFDRVIVSFTGSTTDAEGAAVLDDAVSAVTRLERWTRVGLSPATNSWQVELEWDSTATVADWEDLADVLQEEPSVDEVGAEVPVSAAAAGFGPGQDVATSWTTVQHHYAAFDMVAIEEAWRLFAGTSPTLDPGVPDVVVIDSGLLPASPAGSVTRHSVNDSRFSMYGFAASAGGWAPQAESAWFDGSESCAAGSWSHGTFISGIIGARNNGEPRWDGGFGGVLRCDRRVPAGGREGRRPRRPCLRPVSEQHLCRKRAGAGPWAARGAGPGGAVHPAGRRRPVHRDGDDPRGLRGRRHRRQLWDGGRQLLRARQLRRFGGRGGRGTVRRRGGRARRRRCP